MFNLNESIDFLADSGLFLIGIIQDKPVIAASLMVLSLALIALLAATSYQTRKTTVSERRHRRNIAKSRNVLTNIEVLVERGDYPAVFHLLRYEIDPYLFEECVLSAFENRGASIIRSPRYSGDGGVDGIVRYGQGKWLIQSKRYRSNITKSHVVHHVSLCARRKAKGLFVHTGKTGKGSAEVALGSSSVQFLSGRRLADFLAGHLPIDSILF